MGMKSSEYLYSLSPHPITQTEKLNFEEKIILETSFKFSVSTMLHIISDQHSYNVLLLLIKVKYYTLLPTSQKIMYKSP